MLPAPDRQIPRPRNRRWNCSYTERLLWFLVVALPVGLGCMTGDWSAFVTTTVTPNGGGTESEVEHTGNASLSAGPILDRFVGIAFAPLGISVTGVEFDVNGAPIPTSATVSPAHQALLETEADAHGRNPFIHTSLFMQSDEVTISPGDAITLRFTESDGGTAPPISRVAFVGTTLSDLNDGAPLDQAQASDLPEITIDQPMEGESFEAGSQITVSGTVTSEFHITEIIRWYVNEGLVGASPPTGNAFSFPVTLPSNAPPDVLSQPIVIRIEAQDSVERTNSESFNVLAFYLDDDGDGLRNSAEAANLANPLDPDSDGDGLFDGWEVFDSQTDPSSNDSDEDGQWDGSELLLGHDPNDEMDRVPGRARTWEKEFFSADTPETPMISTADNGDRVVAWVDRGPGNDHVHKIIKPDIGAPSRSVIVDPTTTTTSCPAPMDVVDIGVEGETTAIHALCGGANFILIHDGTSLFEAITPAEPLLGGDNLVVFDEFSLGRDENDTIEILVVGETDAGGEEIIASCGPVTAPSCERLIGATDLGGKELSRPGHMGSEPVILLDTPLSGAPAEDLFRLERAGNTPRRMIGAGDPNPTRSIFTITGVNDYAAGMGGAMVEAAFGLGRQHLLIMPGSPDGFQLIPTNPGQTGRRAPDSTSNFGNVHLGSFDDGKFAVNASTTDAENGVWGSRSETSSGFDPPENRVAISDRMFTEPNPAPGVTGSRIEDAMISRQGIAGDTMAVKVQFFGGDQAIGILEPGVAEPSGGGIGSNPQGGTSVVVELKANPARVRPLFQPAIAGLSGLADDPATGIVWGSAGFLGNGGIWNIDDMNLTTTFIGPSNFDATPAYEIMNGVHYTTVPTSGGGANALATVDPMTGAATVKGPLQQSGGTPVDLDVLAHHVATDTLLSIETTSAGVPWTLHRVDTANGELTPLATIPNVSFSWTPAGGDIVGEQFFVTFGGGGGHWAFLDLTSLNLTAPSAPAAAAPLALVLPELPLYFLIDAASGSMSDFVMLDRDGDGLSDFDEGAIGTNANDPDSDGDGLADGAEVNQLLTDPNLADSDGDSLSDGDERTVYSTDPNLFDTDGDGFSDGDEISLGTDPNDANDNPGPLIPVGATFTGTLVLALCLLVAFTAWSRRAGASSEPQV